MRIARALAMAGIDSRRKCEIYIANGEVTVNGEAVRDLGRQVDPENDQILFRGRPVHFEHFVYFVLHKPAGFTTTAADPNAKKTVYDLLPRTLVTKVSRSHPSRTRVFPVGRLDRGSTGLLLFTNDGDLANRLTHPRFGLGKWYEVRLARTLNPRDGHRLLAGIPLEEGTATVEKFHKISRRQLRLLIREGKKREVRRIFEKLGYEVVTLCRIAFGPLTLGHLAPGEGRFLTPPEVCRLKEEVFEADKAKHETKNPRRRGSGFSYRPPRR